jgi:hypothetical protein
VRLVRKCVEVRLHRETHYLGFGAEACAGVGVEMILLFDSADLIQAVAYPRRIS